MWIISCNNMKRNDRPHRRTILNDKDIGNVVNTAINTYDPDTILLLKVDK